MAIFRARGGRSLTTWPPMRIFPAVGASSPAIIRSSVVLPQPDGPRRTRNSPSWVARSTPSTARTSPKCLLTARVSTVARSNQPLLLPLAEDAPAGRVGFLERLLGRGRAAGRLGEHDVQHPGAEDLVDGRVGVARVADVGGPAEDVLQHLVLVERVGLGVVADELRQGGHRLREAREVVELTGHEGLPEVRRVVDEEPLGAVD